MKLLEKSRRKMKKLFYIFLSIYKKKEKLEIKGNLRWKIRKIIQVKSEKEIKSKITFHSRSEEEIKSK